MGGGILMVDEEMAQQQQPPQRGMMNRGTNRLEGSGNQPFGVEPTDYAPLGSGVLMLMATGLGYAVVKSKKRKRICLMLLLPVLLMGLSQCKKENKIPETPTLEGEPYQISVTLGRASDSKADVYPYDSVFIAPVYYEKDRDTLLVVYRGAVVGALKCVETYDYYPNDPMTILKTTMKPRRIFPVILL